jgi:hypothetical protein
VSDSYEQHFAIKLKGPDMKDQVALEKDFKQHQELAQQQQQNINPLEAARANIIELQALANETGSMLSTVGAFAPFFDVNYLTKEGLTDLSKVDMNYLLTIGQQLVNDHNGFSSRAENLRNAINALTNEFNALYNSVLTVNMASAANVENNFMNIITGATTIHSDFVEWSENFIRIINSAMVDIANHLNQARAPEHAINIAQGN